MARSALRGSSKTSVTHVPRVGSAGAVLDPLVGHGGVPACPTPTADPRPQVPCWALDPSCAGTVSSSESSLTKCADVERKAGGCRTPDFLLTKQEAPRPPALPHFLHGAEVLSTAFGFRHERPMRTVNSRGGKGAQRSPRPSPFTSGPGEGTSFHTGRGTALEPGSRLAPSCRLGVCLSALAVTQGHASAPVPGVASMSGWPLVP